MRTIFNNYTALQSLVSTAADVFAIDEQDIIFKQSSKRGLCDVRDLICHIAAKVAYIGVSKSVLAQFTGRKDHSSVYHSIEKAENLLFYDTEFQRKHKEVLTRFNESFGDERYSTERVDNELFSNQTLTATA